jgi:glycosyltransferase involved in cell wall biosynthesis
VVALPSHIEGVPSVVMEALACGRAVVATAVGGVPEIVRDGRSGWLVPDRDPAALASALVEALARPAERARRAAVGRDLVADRFRADLAARRLETLYDRWLGVDAVEGGAR